MKKGSSIPLWVVGLIIIVIVFVPIHKLTVSVYVVANSIHSWNIIESQSPILFHILPASTMRYIGKYTLNVTIYNLKDCTTPHSPKYCPVIHSFSESPIDGGYYNFIVPFWKNPNSGDKWYVHVALLQEGDIISSRGEIYEW